MVLIKRLYLNICFQALLTTKAGAKVRIPLQRTFMLDRRVLWVGDIQRLNRNRRNPSCAQVRDSPVCGSHGTPAWAVLRDRARSWLEVVGQQPFLDRSLSDIQSREVACLWCLT